MKKITSIILILSLMFSFLRIDNTNARILGPDFNVKSSSNADESYNSRIDNIGNSVELNFKNLSIVTDYSTGTYSINFPSGFTYNSYNLTENTCGFNLISASNSSFKYSFSDNSGFCESIVILNYTVNSASNGDNTINVLDGNNNILDSVIVNIVNLNSITKAETIDSNRNGFIDSYKLTFSENITGSFSNSGLTIGGITPSLSGSISNNIAYLSFTDGIFDTRETPQILDLDGGMFNNVGSISNNNINEIDGVSAEILNFNSSIYTGGSVNMDGNSNIDLLLSEDLNSGLTNNNLVIKDKNNLSITGIVSQNGSGLTFNPNSTLYSDKNPFTLTGITDWAGNNTSLVININDNVSPNGNLISNINTGILINHGNIYSQSQNVNLNLSGSDDTGISQMMISNDSLFTNSSWISYTGNYNWNLSNGTGIKNVYVKFKDLAGNISATYNDSITWDTSIPNVGFSQNSGNYNNSFVLTMTGTPNNTNIYYTLDGTNPNSSSGTLYTTGILIGTGISNYNFKVLGIFTDNSGSINSEIYSKTYSFNCPIISNGNVNCTYPTFTFTCNSGYHKDGNSCAKDVSSSGGGGGGPSSISTCLDSQLVCTNGVYYRKSGVSCNNGNLGKSCTISSTGATNTGTTNTGITNQTGSTNTGNINTSTGVQVPEIIDIIKSDGTKISITDISSNFAKNYIINLASSGIINGYSDNTFRPNNNTTRIEFLKILLRGLGKDYLSYAGQKNPFWDVPDNSWQSPILIKALELGIISKNKYFYPDKTISREEAMKMLIKTSGLNIVSIENSSFNDSNGWAKNYIETAYKNGIINGQTINGDFVFRPLDNITRAEVAKLIIRTIEFIKK